MGERLRRTAARQPGRAAGVLAAVAVLGTALAAGWTDRLALSTNATARAPLEIRVSGELAAESAAFRVAVATMRSQLSANPAVTEVRERGGERRSTVLVVRFDVGGRKRDAAIARLERNLDPGPLTLSFRGEAAAVRRAKDAAIDDLYLLLIALPLVALVAIATLGIRRGGAALLAAAAAAALSALVSELLAGAIDVSFLALVGAATGGSLVTLQLCAMARARADSTSICGAALAAAAPFAATALLGLDYLASFGLGGAFGALFAAPASLLAAGAGEAVERPADTAGAGVSAPEDEHRGARGWRWIGDVLGWSSLIAVLIGLLALALLAFSVAPVDGLAFVAIGAAARPEIDAAQLGAAIGAAGLATAVVAALSERQIWLAIAGTLVFALPAAAAAGLLVASIQEGWLEGPLGYVSTGELQLGSLVAAVTVVAAISASQLVGLCAAARRAEGPDKPQRVAEVMAAFGPPLTLACLTGILAGVALCFSSRLFIKEFGLGLAAGLALELVIVGVVLAPALLRLTPDRANRG